MQAESISERAIDELQALLGASPVQGPEDLVVAVSQAVLCALGFEPQNRSTAWQSPGLPQGQHIEEYVFVSGSSQRIEVKWVASGPNVMMLVRPLTEGASSSDVQTIQLQTSKVVAAATEFPFTAAGAPDVIKAALEPEAVETAMAAIRQKLIDTSEPEPPNPPPPRSFMGRPSGPRPGDDLMFTSSSTAHSNPLSVGRDDLDPLGGSGGLGGMDQGGGMVVGPNHPMFRQGGGDGPGPDTDPLRGPQRLPPGAVPPGARFDPIVPHGQAPPGSHPRGGLPRGPPGRGRGRGSGGPFSGEPDPDSAAPPDPSWNFYI
ncbi:hypothetical protein LPJ78_000684 [Coemansia sp. RSA 989]|nr:hypothetical protein LPJ78_000684 [Coemansia sp. RSA 989]KAJ1874700.1 hypothetical protein LPJ55_001307 [Coemansia sp. RSA 990]KAJ2673693.1 hypothetical protein IWW42_002105 [Coemansia sp. RSA 1085]